MDVNVIICEPRKLDGKFKLIDDRITTAAAAVIAPPSENRTKISIAVCHKDFSLIKINYKLKNIVVSNWSLWLMCFHVN